MTDNLDHMPSGSLDDDAGSHPLVPDRGAVVYALSPKEVRQDEEDSSNFWNKLPFLKNRKKKK